MTQGPSLYQPKESGSWEPAEEPSKDVSTPTSSSRGPGAPAPPLCSTDRGGTGAASPCDVLEESVPPARHLPTRVSSRQSLLRPRATALPSQGGACILRACNSPRLFWKGQPPPWWPRAERWGWTDPVNPGNRARDPGVTPLRLTPTLGCADEVGGKGQRALIHEAGGDEAGHLSTQAPGVQDPGPEWLFLRWFRPKCGLRQMPGGRRLGSASTCPRPCFSEA